MRYIAGANAAAKEDGWTVSVIDAAGSADQANTSIQNFAERGAGAIIDMVFPYSSIGAGLAAAKAQSIPVVTWGGGLGGSVAATNGSGAPIAQPVIDQMVADFGGKGDLLALTYRTGEVCRNREILMDQIVAQEPGDYRHQERSPHSRLFRGRRAICQRLAGVASRRRQSCDLGLLGRSGHRRYRFAAPARPRRRQGLWRQRQRPGDREHQERPYDGDRLGRQLHRGLSHGEDAQGDQGGRSRLDPEGGRSARRP